MLPLHMHAKVVKTTNGLLAAPTRWCTQLNDPANARTQTPRLGVHRAVWKAPTVETGRNLE